MKTRNLIIRSVLGVSFLMGAQAVFATPVYRGFVLVNNETNYSISLLGSQSGAISAGTQQFVKNSNPYVNTVPSATYGNICQVQGVSMNGVNLTTYPVSGSQQFVFNPCTVPDQSQLGSYQMYNATFQVPSGDVHKLQIKVEQISKGGAPNTNGLSMQYQAYGVTIKDLTTATPAPSSNATNRQVQGSGASTLGPATNRSSDNPSW